MGRLLWKEWREIRLFLLALAVGPWLVLLFPGANLGYKTHGSGLDVTALMLVLAVWAATRMQEEGGRRNNLSTRTLPVRRGTVAAVKFLPGLIMAFALPFLMQAAGGRFSTSPFVWGYAFGYPITYQFAHYLLLALVIYSVAFLVSMMAHWIVAVGVSTLVAYSGPFGILRFLHIPIFTPPIFGKFGYTGETQTIVLIFLAAFGVLGLFLSNPTARLSRKLWTTAISFVYGYAVFFLLCFLVETAVTRSPFVLTEWAVSRIRVELPRSPFPYWDRHYITSEDGRVFAYPVKYNETRPAVDGPAYRATVEIRAADATGIRSVVKGGYAAPLAFMKNNDLLVALSETGSEMILVRWDFKTGKTEKMTSFARNPKSEQDKVIRQAIASDDGRFVALFVSPVKGSYPDLWMLDTRTKTCKIVAPSLEREGAVTWVGGRLVYASDSTTYWSMKPDGSDEKRVADVRRVLRHD